MNSPSNVAILRSLVIYAICVPLAIFVGYTVTNPMDYSTLGLLGIVTLLLILPLLLRWHHPILVFSWNMTFTLFFIKGAPNLWLAMVVLSLAISLVERALNSQAHFIRVPQITWPLLCLAAVVLMTAKLTGGFGLRALGSEVYGGKKYVFLLAGILSYFALTSRRIPPERAGLYVALFFLGGITYMISDLFAVTPSWAHFIFWFFPPTGASFNEFDVGQNRLGDFGIAGVMLWCFVMARYGIRGIFLSGKLWRLIIFILPLIMVFLGGFRGEMITVGLMFVVQFFLEGLHRTKLMPLFVWLGIIAAVTVIPLASKLPLTFQRTLAFLPLHLDSRVKADAQDSLDWRVNMWKALLPQVPQHLLLGKGLAISPEEFNEMMGVGLVLGTAAANFDPSQNPLALSYDYHSGPLSVILPFGIWGAITFLWFLAASLRAMYRNFRYGDPSLQAINLFLFVNYLVSVFAFIFIWGALNIDIAKFVGLLGLSIAINNGVCRPVPQPVPTGETFLHPRGALPGSRPRPVFTR